MPKEILLPEITADFESGTLERWLKTVGDTIEVGDPFVEVSTDKAVVEIEAEEAGVLGQILVDAGTEDVAVNTPIAILLVGGESADTIQSDNGLQADQGPGTLSNNEEAPAGNESLSASQTRVDPESEGDDRTFASPVAARIAAQLNINLDAVEGSGPGGRIVLGDVESFAARQKPGVRTATKAPDTEGIELPPPGAYTEEPADKIRQVVARRLAAAKREIPHFYLTVDFDIDQLLNLRRQINLSAQAEPNISINDFFIRASALALQDFPAVNVAWSGETILRFKEVDIAVAVATPRGLFTPVVEAVNRKSLTSISSELRELAARARDGRLTPNEYKGGGFTVSNLGMYGIREFSAIINPPQACILAIGAGESRVIVKDGQAHIATIVTCTLSVDHRAVDGEAGAKYLQILKSYIEDPARLS